MSENKSRAVQHIVGYRMTPAQIQAAKSHAPSATEIQRNVRMTGAGRTLWIEFLQESQTASKAVQEAWAWMLRHYEQEFARAVRPQGSPRVFPWREPFDPEGIPVITGCEAVALLLRLMKEDDSPLRKLTEREERTRGLVDRALASITGRLRRYEDDSPSAAFRGDPYASETANQEDGQVRRKRNAERNDDAPDPKPLAPREDEAGENDTDRWRDSNLVETAAAVLETSALALEAFGRHLPVAPPPKGGAPSLSEEAWHWFKKALDWLLSERAEESSLWPAVVSARTATPVIHISIYSSSRVVLAMLTARHALRAMTAQPLVPGLIAPASVVEVEMKLTAAITRATASLLDRVTGYPSGQAKFLELDGWKAQFPQRELADTLYSTLHDPVRGGPFRKALGLDDSNIAPPIKNGSPNYYFQVVAPSSETAWTYTEPLLRALVVGFGGELIPRPREDSSNAKVGWVEDGSHEDPSLAGSRLEGARADLHATAAAVCAVSEAFLADLAHGEGREGAAGATRILRSARDLKVLAAATRYLIGNIKGKTRTQLNLDIGKFPVQIAVPSSQPLAFETLPYEVLRAVGAYRRLSLSDVHTISGMETAQDTWFELSDEHERAYLEGMKWMLAPHQTSTDGQPCADAGLRVDEAGGFVCCGGVRGLYTRPLPGIRSTERALSALRYFEAPENVRQVGELLAETLNNARREIIKAFKETYEPLENKHQIRVAWGLIEAEAKNQSEAPSGDR